MATEGWEALLEDSDWARGPGKFAIAAYSEFMPGPWMGIKPYGTQPRPVRDPEDLHGWLISEHEQAFELRPGLEIIARELIKEIMHLGQGLPTPRIGKLHLKDNPYWPTDLAGAAGKLTHEKYLTLAPVALSRTQDDKGRIRWTLFGGSNLGPAAGFWQGFWRDPTHEQPAAEGLAFFHAILTEVYGESVPVDDLAKAGLRILPVGKPNLFPEVAEAIPPWCSPFLWNPRQSLKGVRYLLTFRAFDHLPARARAAYLKGDLHLLPFPGSLVFWGSPNYRRLLRDLPLAMQTCFLQLFARTNAAHGMRIPQMGWVDYHRPDDGTRAHGPRRHTYVRTHRYQRLRRDQEETEQLDGGDQVSHVIFSTEPQDLGLYNKPMARNTRLWTDQFRLLLDGPRADRNQIYQAAEQVREGGRFGYRFVFPAMRVGTREVYWHRPIAAYPGPTPETPKLLENAPLGYLTAVPLAKESKEAMVPLWPRPLSRPIRKEAIELFLQQRQPRWYSEAMNVRAILEFGGYMAPNPMPASFARALLLMPKGHSIDQWLASLPVHAANASGAEQLAAEIRPLIAPEIAPGVADPEQGIIYPTTMTREFEVSYWETIVKLAHSDFKNKDNADCFQDEPTKLALERLQRPDHRDLEALGDYLMDRYQQVIATAGMTGQAWVGEHAFHWTTDFEFQRWDAWQRNQNGEVHERNIVVRIPGRDSTQTVILADHYDTAYMYDEYEQKAGGTGARIAAHGADDNHSATAALLLAAPILLELSKQGKLECDIWLVHLTGEEFPSDCLGARNLCQALVERTLKVIEPGGVAHDLSKVTCRGVYVADMIAHNNPHDRNVFQMAPGEGKASAWLAYQAHRATGIWNRLAQEANSKPPRKGMDPFVRSVDPGKMPAPCPHACVRGEVRPDWDPRSTLYNTDGQIFSDAGVPVVLFMEDYDINRSGYHDTHDTMENIDLDYGSALASIFIESAVRAATLEPGKF
jgi:hypothetical protein